MIKMQNQVLNIKSNRDHQMKAKRNEKNMIKKKQADQSL